ncbi:DinB family protein [Aureitalea marina]|uniref:DUF1572 domain-containing protein n=1 Tax=Aureitalea marina TaxID=930804 RepID=A0A2S7KP86_9FLAO|nr:DinB family protein [Aureitalea marina]PQB04435.1 hypothetical protein BST85_05620 [Aureitalea marina]
MSWIEEFRLNACYRMDESSRMIRRALDELSEDELWKKPNSQLNSIANLILHLQGNITQYVIASLGNKSDKRQRDLEFDTRGGLDKHELFQGLLEVVNEAKEVINTATEEEYIRVRSVQGFNFSGVGVVMHAVEHYSYHTGQIAFWVKLLKDEDLGFYDGMNLNTKNEDYAG